MKRPTNYLIFILSVFFSLFCSATTYYIDFDKGNDAHAGTSVSTAWKHCPGDENATGVPSSAELLPGDILLFKGGVKYKGAIEMIASGGESEGSKISYIGNAWPGLEGIKAIIDGSELLAGWLPEAGNRYSAEIPAMFTEETSPLMYNLHEFDYSAGEDEFLWMAQDPDPADPFFNSDRTSFMTVTNENITRTSITDPQFFIQTDESYWDNSYLLIWINPNLVVSREILSFNPATYTITFEDLGENAIYPDERDQYYAIYNSIRALDTEGEYYVDKTLNKIYIKPRNVQHLDSSITYSARAFGFDINGQSHLRIEGFIIRKVAGEGLRDAVGIGCRSSASVPVEDIEIVKNEVYHARHEDRGYGGIYLSSATNCIVKGNIIQYCPDSRGIFISGGDNVIVQNNYILRSGVTSLTMYGCTNSQILFNTVRESKGDHANGITIYIASKNILVAGNRVCDSNSPFTFQDSGDLFFINNLIDANDGESNVNEWGRTSRGPWEHGQIVFLNNTFVKNSRNAAVNIGSGGEDLVVNDTLTIPGNTYVFMNNILDGGAGSDSIVRNYNIYTGLAWNQSDRYGWSLETHEMVNENTESIFADPESGDFHLLENSDAVNAGVSVVQYYPIDVFPDFNFLSDIDGKMRPLDGTIDIGAYEYGDGPFVDNGEYRYDDSDTGNAAFYIYPNPARQEIYIYLQNMSGNNTIIKLVSADGKMMMKKDISLQLNSVDISSLPAGVYFVIVQNDQSVIGYRNIVKK